MTADRQFDPTVLRKATFGDVQIGHHLDPRRDGEGQVSWRRNHFVQHAVRLDADPELVFKRFKMHVAGVVLDGQQEHHVQQFADRALSANASAPVKSIGPSPAKAAACLNSSSSSSNSLMMLSTLSPAVL